MAAKILLRLDANPVIGLGHAVRVSGLVSLLSTPPLITISGNGEILRNHFPESQILSMPEGNPDAFFDHIETVNPELIIVDHPRPGNGFWRKLKTVSGNTPVVAIDDEGGDIEADIVFNGTVLGKRLAYPKLDSGAMCLVGPQYSLIRPAFAGFSWCNKKVPSVAIVVGSGDRAFAWALHLASGNVDMSGWGQITMIVGRAFPHMAKLREDCKSCGIYLYSGLSEHEMASVLTKSSVALITGGMIVYEALATGVPSIVFPQIRNAIPEAEWFASNGCIVNLGYDGGMQGKMVSSHVKRLLSSESDRLFQSRTGKSIVDGLGMRRAATAIQAFLFQHKHKTTL